MRKVLEIGGFIAALVLICFGVASIVMGVNARSTVQSTLNQEQIVGTPDMTPAAIKAEAKQAGLADSIPLPTVAVAGLPINTGDRAHAFASYMRIHALEATGGQTYAQMARYATTDGKGTNDATLAVKDANGQPLDNPVRQVWVTETALSTALNTSYMAAQLSLFGIVVGIALLLSGIGFGVLALGGALRNRETALGFLSHPEPRAPTATGTVQPV
jgi:F0F1-type ATP synthase membrane subunit c/vacuolar-type H+-ATPase subunit K